VGATKIEMMVAGKLVHLPYLDARQYTELPWRKA
jgi:hypothetical protein